MSTNAGKTEDRGTMEKFWRKHSTECNEKEMMLDYNAESIGRREIPEILALLPNIRGKVVLELGAGIGRFTGHLAEEADAVIAVDFMESFTQKNRENNGHHSNTDFRCCDVTKLDLPPNSIDLVFSNWLFMYLSDAEIKSVFTKMLTWLRPDGQFFFRESCRHQSGNAPHGFNPTKYRDPQNYLQMALSVAVEETRKGNDSSAMFQLNYQKAVQTYIELKNNHNQICWLLNKVSTENRPSTMNGFH